MLFQLVQILYWLALATWFGGVLFIAVAAAWFATTTIGMLRARTRRFAEQHEWMIRSYALALFFVTFSLWGPALAATSVPSAVAYPLAQILSAGVNLGIAELYIRRTRRARPAAGPALAGALP